MRAVGQLALRKFLLFAVSLSLLALFMSAAARVYRASRHAQIINLENLQAAVQLEPGNAEYRFRLGKYYAVEQELPKALENFKLAVQFNPYEARYWLELASAYLATGDLQEEKNALHRAMQVDPTTPEVSWIIANLQLVQGDTVEALQRLRALLEHDPESLGRALDVSWRATHNAQLVLDNALPAEPDDCFAFLYFLIHKGRPEDAAKTWAHVMALQQSFPPRLAFPYLQYLLESGHAEQAGEAWKQMAGVAPSLQPYLAAENRIVNGGFEEEILNGGLDWRYEARRGANVAIDINEAHGGQRSLSVTFEGAAVDDAGIYQFIVVRPDTRYRFHGFIKSADVQSVSGPRLLVYDAKSNAPYLLTDSVLGSRDWREETGEFTTGPNTNLLVLRIVRSPARPLIRGRIWVDDLSLTPG